MLKHEAKPHVWKSKVPQMVISSKMTPQILKAQPATKIILVSMAIFHFLDNCTKMNNNIRHPFRLHESFCLCNISAVAAMNNGDEKKHTATSLASRLNWVAHFTTWPLFTVVAFIGFKSNFLTTNTRMYDTLSCFMCILFYSCRRLKNILHQL